MSDIPLFVHVIVNDTGAIIVDGTGDTPQAAQGPYLKRVMSEATSVSITPEGRLEEAGGMKLTHAVLVNLTGLFGGDVATVATAIMTDPGLNAIYQLGKDDGSRRAKADAERRNTPILEPAVGEEAGRRLMWLHLVSIHAESVAANASAHELTMQHRRDHLHDDSHHLHDRSWSPDLLVETIAEHERNA